MNRFIRHPIRATLALAIIACLPASPVMAQSAPAPAADARANFTIAAGDLAGALDQFSTQTGIQFVYAPGLTAGKQVEALSGRLTWQAALERLLRGSGLVYEEVGTKMVVIRKGPDDRAKPDPRPAVEATSASAAETPLVANLQAVTVTGTRIRGGVTASPTITIDSQQIKQEGFTDLGELIRSIPQNFSGGQNPGVASGNNGNIANQNITGASALNLRGLGPDATLTLLNGRRLTYEGFVQAVDISAIPIEAVDRIEIIPDGASAIYGSDAVAGVANVILKRDFDGVTVGARYGEATSGGLSSRVYTVTAGTSWSSGGLIATYKESSKDSIFADQRGYTQAMDDPTTLYGGGDMRSGLVSGYQLIGDAVRLQLDALRTDRKHSLFSAYQGYYNQDDSDTSVSQVSPTVEFSLPADWAITLGGVYGKDENIYRSYYGGGGVLDLQATGCYCNKNHSYEIGAEGPLFTLGGGGARLATGVGSRAVEFYEGGWSSRQGGKEQSNYGYIELNLPFIGPTSEAKGAHRLEFSAALRSEDYDNFGRVTTPKLGLIYDPSASFTFKATWGKSFKAPTLIQRYQGKYAYLWGANQLGGTGYPDGATVLMSYGGNADLNPERARTWTVSLAFHPEVLLGLDAEITWFDIDYTERVEVPTINFSQALNDPNFAQFIQYSPTPDQQADLLAVYNKAFYNFAGVDYDASKVVALAFDQYTNAARQRVKGVDLSGSYRIDIGGDGLTLRGAATWLESSQQNSVGQSAFDLAGTIFNPAKIKSRLGAVWTRGGFAISGFANYVGGVTSRLGESAEKTASFTTFDAMVSYSTGELGGILSGMEFVLSADNLLNRNPPLYKTSALTFVPYDSTNYSAIGRYLSLSVSKHW
jgi:outer membrane receptor protein involved in Fe transport